MENRRKPKYRYNGAARPNAEKELDKLKKLEACSDKRAAGIAQTVSNMFKFMLLSAAMLIGGAIISIHSIFYSSKNQIKGLTTAAGLWAVGMIGLALGMGIYSVALIAFVVILCTLLWFPPLERAFKNRSNHFEMQLELTSSVALQDFVTVMRKLGLVINEIEQNPAFVGSGLSVYTVAISVSSEMLKKYKSHAESIQALGTLEYVRHIEEMEF